MALATMQLFLRYDPLAIMALQKVRGHDAASLKVHITYTIVSRTELHVRIMQDKLVQQSTMYKNTRVLETRVQCT